MAHIKKHIKSVVYESSTCLMWSQNSINSTHLNIFTEAPVQSSVLIEKFKILQILKIASHF